ncbi:MAG: TonB family protein [Bacteroidota bacterium]|nr:TonB family protein [Bacteroidota bacterium]
MMKNLFLLFLMMCGFTAYAQETFYFNASGKKIATRENAKSYIVIDKDSMDKTHKIVSCFDINSRLMWQDRYSVLRKYKENSYLLDYLTLSPLRWYALDEDSKRDGQHKEWYSNGQLHVVIDFTDGVKSGELKSYWMNGSVKRHDVYKNGEIQKGECLDSLGNKVPYYDYAVKPQISKFDGDVALYLAHNVRYPAQAQELRIQGRIITRFTITETGDIANFEILRSVHPILDAEARRVIEGSGKWVPGMLDGKEVSVPVILPVNFRLQ